MSGQRILVVDDVGFNRILLERQLTNIGYVVEQAGGGDEAYQLLSVERFDLVVTDLMMPDMSGVDLFAKVQERGTLDDHGENPIPPFILCTAHAEPEVMEDAIKAGFKDVLTKPVERERLVESVKRALEGALDSQDVRVAGDDATILKTISQLIDASPEEVIDIMLEALSVCEFGDEINNPEAFREFLADKLSPPA